MLNPKRLLPSHFRKPPLRLVLIFGFIVPLVSAGGLVAYLTWRNDQQAIEQLVAQIQERVGDRIQERLTHFTDTPPHATQLMLRALERSELDAQDLASWGEYLRDQSDIFEALTFIYFGNQAGDYIELHKRSDEQRQIILRSGQQPHLLQQLNSTDPRQVERVVRTQPFDPRVRPWYQAVTDGQSHWTDFYDFYLQSSKLKAGESFPTTLGMSFIRPYYAPGTQQLLGVLGADFTLTDINRFLGSLTISKSGKAFILDRQGRVIASSLPETQVRNDQTLQPVQEFFHPLIRRTGESLIEHHNGIDKIHRVQTLSFRMNGSRQMLQVRPFADAYGLDWLIVVVVPESDFTRSIWANTPLTVLLGSGVLGLAVLLSLLFVRKISTATDRLRQASEAIAQGNFQQTIPGATIRELDAMAQAFNVMSRALQQSYAQIESYSQSLAAQVQSRTQALEEEVEKRQRANLATQQSEQRYHSLFDDAPISLWEQDFSAVKRYLDQLSEKHSPMNIKDYLEQHPDVVEQCVQLVRILDVNQAALELCEAQQKGDLLARLNHDSPEALEGFKQELIALSQGEIIIEKELVNSTLTGKKKYILFKLSLVSGHEADWSRVLISIIDISDRKFAEEAMRQQARRDRLAKQVSQVLMNQEIDAAIDFVLQQIGEFTQSDRCCIFQAQEAGYFQMTYEWCEPHVQSFQTDRQSITPEQFPWFCRQVNQLKPFQIYDLSELPSDAIATRQEFERQSIRSMINVPMVYSGVAIGFLGLDAVQHPKQWSSEDVNFLQLIGEMIAISQAKHTAEIAMKRAKEEAEVANRTKSEFLANMSHELRSPLNAILGFAQLMTRSHTLSPEHLEDVGIINRSGQHLLNLINDVLDMSKIEAGKITMQLTDFSLDHLLDDLEKIFQFKAKDKNLFLIFDRDAQLPHYVRADQRKLRQILINVLGNAIKFTKTGGVTLRIKTIDSSSPINPKAIPMLMFEVQDTGEGVQVDEMAQVFDPFIQTQTGKASHEGTGLGLPISREFVELMGGEMILISQVPNAKTYAIGVEDIETPMLQGSPLGPGTLVRFTIPHHDIQTLKVDPEILSKTVLSLVGGRPVPRILVVDDSPYNRKLLVKLLQPVGFLVQEADNGKHALERWQTWHPHLIWMDLKMPIMDGLEATRQIRRRQSSAPVQPKIIALSASSFSEDHQSALQAGCDDFMRKPFRDIDIFEMIQQHIQVDYIYDDATVEDVAIHSQVEQTTYLNPTALGKLPPALVFRLEDAIRRIAWTQIFTIIEEIRLIEPDVATILSETVHKFQYQLILDSIQPLKEQV